MSSTAITSSDVRGRPELVEAAYTYARVLIAAKRGPEQLNAELESYAFVLRKAFPGWPERVTNDEVHKVVSEVCDLFRFKEAKSKEAVA